jgi:hypothetical protein
MAWCKQIRCFSPWHRSIHKAAGSTARRMQAISPECWCATCRSGVSIVSSPHAKSTSAQVRNHHDPEPSSRWLVPRAQPLRHPLRPLAVVSWASAREGRTNGEEARTGFLFRIEENQLGRGATIILQSANPPQTGSEGAKVVRLSNLCRSFIEARRLPTLFAHCQPR